jgi:DNA-binding response OmpR family regulator
VPTVLIVDDEQHIRLLIEQTLEELEDDDVQLLTAADGEAALDVVEHQRPELVFLDIQMPKRNGFEVCREIKARPELAGTTVILLTARGQAADRDEGRDAGADDYVTKPFDPLDLIARVNAVLARRRAS